MPSGTLHQVSRRHGQARHGHRQIPEVSVRRQARTNANTNARQTTTGTVPAKPAMQRRRTGHVRPNLRTLSGTITVKTENSLRHGTARRGLPQAMIRATTRVQGHAVTNALTIITTKTGRVSTT